MGLYLKSVALFVFAFIIVMLTIKAILSYMHTTAQTKNKFILHSTTGFCNFSHTIKKCKYILIFLIFFTLFYTYTVVSENNYQKIYETYANKEVLVQAIVMSKPEEKEYKNTYEIKVTKIEDIETKEQSTKSFNLLCNIKKENNLLNYGDKIEFISTYKLPSIKRNEGGFDYMQYLKNKKIAGIVDTTLEEIKVIEKNKAPLTKTIIHNFKNNLITKVTKILPKETAGICIGLLLGDKTLISEEVQNNFKQSSLSHMLAISGAHVSYILLGITTFLQVLKAHKRWSKIVIIIFLIFFMTLVGYTPSVTRACIMSIISLMAGILFRKSNIYQNLALSSIIILLMNPYSLLDIGFQLSFGGTIGIVIFMQKQVKTKIQNELIINSNEKNKLTEDNILKCNSKQNELANNNTLIYNSEKNEQINKSKVKSINKNKLIYKILEYIKGLIKVSVSANLIILPIMIYHFNTISATFLISNILASPILAVSLILGLIFIVFVLIFNPIAIIISYILNVVLQILIQITNFTSKLPLSQILISTPKLWQIALYYFILLTFKQSTNNNIIDKENLEIKEVTSNYNVSLIMKKIFSKYQKIILIIEILILIFPYFIKIPTSNLNINFIDVGQGDSTLIETPSRKTILIDGGGSEFGSFDVGEKTLLPYLLDKNIMKLDYIMFSHFDTDHCGGLLTILEKIKVKNIIISKQGEVSSNFKHLLEIIRNKNVNIIVAKAGTSIKIDKECYFYILFPEDNLISENVLNNNSIVAKFYYRNNFSILFTGDIEKIAENRLIELYKNTTILKSNILKVAHHGSKTSSTQELLKLINPQIALIGVGENNKFGHPSDITIQNLEKLRNYNL